MNRSAPFRIAAAATPATATVAMAQVVLPTGFDYPDGSTITWARCD